MTHRVLGTRDRWSKTCCTHVAHLFRHKAVKDWCRTRWESPNDFLSIRWLRVRVPSLPPLHFWTPSPFPRPSLDAIPQKLTPIPSRSGRSGLVRRFGGPGRSPGRSEGGRGLEKPCRLTGLGQPKQLLIEPVGHRPTDNEAHFRTHTAERGDSEYQLAEPLKPLTQIPVRCKYSSERNRQHFQGGVEETRPETHRPLLY